MGGGGGRNPAAGVVDAPAGGAPAPDGVVATFDGTTTVSTATGSGATGANGALLPGAAVGSGAPVVTGGATYGPRPFSERKRSCFSQYCYE